MIRIMWLRTYVINLFVLYNKWKNILLISWFLFSILSQRKYEEFKDRISDVIAKFQNVPPEGLIMKDGSPWPGNDVRNHPSMIQVLSQCSKGMSL